MYKQIQELTVSIEGSKIEDKANLKFIHIKINFLKIMKSPGTLYLLSASFGS